MAGAYLSIEEFKLRTTMPSGYVDELERIQRGYVAARLLALSRLEIDGPLRKRYAAPFDEPFPEWVKEWLARLATVDCWDRRGVDPGDAGFDRAVLAAERVRTQIAEAADGTKGLWDLPTRDDSKASGISKAGPLTYSEQSPYVAYDVKAGIGRQEDASGGGTSRG